jgi:hypothetical protein
LTHFDRLAKDVGYAATIEFAPQETSTPTTRIRRPK